MRRIWQFLIHRYPWLDAQHPLAQRDLARIPVIPHFFRRLTEVRSILGYAALIHLIMFIVAMIIYTYLPPAFSGWLAPFLTPFGMPVAAAMLHSILYWGLLIGVCNNTTALVSRDVKARSLELLRLTPYNVWEIVLTKLTALRSSWRGILLALLITRLVAGLSVPLSNSLEAHKGSPFDYLQTAMFIVQPIFDMLLVTSLSILSSVITADPTWARLSAYGMIGLTLGALGTFNSIWLVFTSPLGAMAGMFGPLSHWSMLAVALTPRQDPDWYVPQLVVMATVHLILPLLIGILALRQSVKLISR
ncbi:MAG: hypothetical protein U0528_14835 [Anaerolineae bacterium]|nr:hypothetical protein [Anaerolineae bacterium]